MQSQLPRIAVAAAALSLITLSVSSQSPSQNPVPSPSKGDPQKKAPISSPAPVPAAKKGGKKADGPQPAPPALLAGDVLSLRHETLQRDFPVACTGADGVIWFAYLENDGTADTLWLGRKKDGGLEPVAPLSEPGILHQPAIAVDGMGRVWCVWGQTGKDDIVHLHARSWDKGTAGDLVTVSDSAGSDTFADAGTDGAGRVWVTWQSMRAGEGDIFSRYLSPDTGAWSEEIAVSIEPGGDWEPRIAFDGEGKAWILYDSSRGNEFNLYLARVSLDGKVETVPIGHSPRFEGRVDFAPSIDGRHFWIAAEQGRVRWGLDVRGHENDKGINAQKKVLFGRFDVASRTFQEIPLGPAGEAGNPVNLPSVGVDAQDRPWVAYRYFLGNRWEIAVTRYDPDSQTWSARGGIPSSAQGQDRHAPFLRDSSGSLWLNWPSDLRTTKACQVAGVYLARMDTERNLAPATPPSDEPKDPLSEPFAASQETPERPPDDRHLWSNEGTTYGLYWGDLHRHTDVSNCRTGFDGCIVDHFRYAYDMAKLDFLGTTDHTDIGKIYHPYEWWHNQRMHDVFHTPGQFASLYVYEREQRWPWGHRNVVFAERGGPIVYIQRTNYRNSPWQSLYPAEPGVGEIEPAELWEILRASGKKVAILSHTGATGMGTDWAGYDGEIDHSIENTVEIFQGARVSYEGIGTPQPTAGLRPGEGYTADNGEKSPNPPEAIENFGKFNPGVYQNALALGLRLGLFASSDHISQHVSYGGVYVKEFTRDGILEAFQARRTVAATDKIYLEFTCNGHPLGSIFSTNSQPAMTLKIDGTAKLKTVTIVRNEADWKTFSPEGNTFETTCTDTDPIIGENRYYLRVTQEDGNMAWASPVWVTFETEGK